MNLIVAIDAHNAIGKDNQLLDHFSKDLKHFKETTLNKIVVMGKSTYYSLPKKPLPNRINIVLSSTMEKEDGCIVCKNMDELFQELDKYNDEDVFVIGGASIYTQLYPYCNKFYITQILKKYENANKFFNEYKEIEKFRLTSWKAERENEIGLDFLIYERDI